MNWMAPSPPGHPPAPPALSPLDRGDFLEELFMPPGAAPQRVKIPLRRREGVGSERGDPPLKAEAFFPPRVYQTRIDSGCATNL